jgi:hypothetical protein
MPCVGRLSAWIEPTDDGRYRAAFISAEAVPGIPPAVCLCASLVDARRKVEDLAASIRFQVEWLPCHTKV